MREIIKHFLKEKIYNGNVSIGAELQSLNHLSDELYEIIMQEDSLWDEVDELKEKIEMLQNAIDISCNKVAKTIVKLYAIEEKDNKISDCISDLEIARQHLSK